MTARSKLLYSGGIVLIAGLYSVTSTPTVQAASLFDFWRSDPDINQVDDLGDYGVDTPQPRRNGDAATPQATVPAGLLNQATVIFKPVELQPSRPASAWQKSAAAGAEDDLGDYDEDYRHAPAIAGSSRPVKATTAPRTTKAKVERASRQPWQWNDVAQADDLGDYGENHAGGRPQTPMQPAAVDKSLAGLPAEWRVTAEELRAFLRNEVPERKERQAEKYDWSTSPDVGGEDDLGDYSEDYRS